MYEKIVRPEITNSPFDIDRTISLRKKNRTAGKAKILRDFSRRYNSVYKETKVLNIVIGDKNLDTSTDESAPNVVRLGLADIIFPIVKNGSGRRAKKYDKQIAVNKIALKVISNLSTSFECVCFALLREIRGLKKMVEIKIRTNIASPDVDLMTSSTGYLLAMPKRRGVQIHADKGNSNLSGLKSLYVLIKNNKAVKYCGSPKKQ